MNDTDRSLPQPARSDSGFLLIGEAVVDVTVAPTGERRSPGGSPANTALVLGRLGHQATLITALGDDADGAAIHQWLATAGVRVEAQALDRTSIASAIIGPDGSAGYSFDITWRLAELSLPQQQPVCVHIGSIGAWLAPGADNVEAFVRRIRGTRRVSFDPNIRPNLIQNPDDVRKRVERLVTLSDIVKVSNEDIAWLRPGEPHTDVAADWLAAGASIVVVTLGGDGALAFTKDQSFWHPPTPTDVVDTIGAGDTFMGAFLASLRDLNLLPQDTRSGLGAISRHQLRAVVRRSSDAAAITVSRHGAHPPHQGEIDSTTSYLAISPAQVLPVGGSVPK